MPGPVVIWNLIRRCNLRCKHCYSTSLDIDFKDELTTEQIKSTIDDLKVAHVPVLILSGGEPLLRPDIYEITEYAKQKGFYLALSTNGTLINEENIEAIKAAVDAGQPVHWTNTGYVVHKDALGQYLITYRHGGSTIGLTDQSGTRLNGDEAEFYVAGANNDQS